MENIIFITSYPRKNFIHGKSTVGVASFAKNTLMAIKKVAGKRITLTVLAEKLMGEKSYREKGIVVKRIWERNSFSIFPNLLKEIGQHKSDTVAIEFEFAMFGDLLKLLPFPLFLVTLRLIGKKVVIVLHHVATDRDNIAPQINIAPYSFKGTILSIGIKSFYKMLLLLSTKVIVFEEALKGKLSKFGNSKKIVVIPHGVEKFDNVPSKIAARKRLKINRNDYVILSFGFLAWYKGTDWILNAVSNIKQENPKSNIKLILAGGANPNRTDKEFYKKYIDSLIRVADINDVTITGFVPEEKIVDYYASSDVVVFPYRTHMSSSGPLSMAFAFKKPFLLSNTLKGVLEQKDVVEFLREEKIDPSTLLFKETNDLYEKIKTLRRSPKLSYKLSVVSNQIATERNWDNIGGRYYEELLKFN